MTGPLAGATLIVTRPAAQAGRFIELATAAGARCIAYPTLEIEPLSLDETTRARLRERDWDWAIFTSTNAVECARAQLAFPLARHCAAVGRATARALEATGLTVDARPESASSEGLLALPAFGTVAGLQILLVKGSGGRDVLPAVLRERGATVQVIEVYRRRTATPDPAAAIALQSALTAPDAATVVATSVEILHGLLELVPGAEGLKLRRAGLLVPGARVAAAARQLDWQGPITEARTAEDEAMIDALVRRRTGREPTP